MKVKLPKELLGSLPAPDSQGFVRVTASLRVDGDGNAEVVELGDVPVDSAEPADDKTDDANPMPPDSLPNLDDVEASLYG